MPSADKAAWLAEDLLGWGQIGAGNTWWEEPGGKLHGGISAPWGYLTTGNGMLEIIDAMRERGHDLTLATRKEGVSGCFVHLSKMPSPVSSFHVDGGWFEAETFPLAVIESAWEALQEGEDG